MNILAIDPGNIESAYVLMDEHYKPIQFGKTGNEDMLEIIEDTMPDCGYRNGGLVWHGCR
jgi:hypothetical protein